MALLSGTCISCNEEDLHHGKLHMHREGDGTSVAAVAREGLA